ncbi:RNA polymerase factor sigma-54 [Cardinium endosymbiont of Oedothorax gibbosus]|uniref:RNA polymerase factor sigma-54 n=1 Tax=Cardinium endosymbiont of Oedothorax gibbosus TaxID=931101 RepID=UPI002024AA21|nr:RNA polymerase factor sigma-54 [Cardinium endosymbiont of Oedothorax gibbosus]CAH2560021.1 RNA polymerase sigma-54 factor [Cardinium endosymbiont of Oedothorax gibbosus]
MQKLQLEQKLAQRLSGQQIQFIKLLQVPTVALNDYISQEVTANPLLDERKEVENKEEGATEPFVQDFSDCRSTELNKKIYKTQPSRDLWTPAIVSLQEKLKEQLYLLHLSKVGYIIGEHLIGSLDQDGYLQCDLEVVVQDLHVMHYLELSLQEVEEVLTAIQRLDPPGIAARNLQECLLIQLREQDQKDPIIRLAQRVISSCFEAFTKKHYETMVKKLGLTDRHLLKNALAYIARLNPRPGRHNHGIDDTNDYLTPDFIIVEHQGKLTAELVHYPVHRLRFNKKYLTMLEAYEQKPRQDLESQEMVSFLKKKLEHAKWFMEALSQRSQTLLKTMEAILQLQYTFFVEGEETDRLKPMVLQHVADKVGMDASTISRIVNQKSVQGKFGVYPLKFFFSEGVRTATGADISNKVVKNRILELIDSEDKQNPYSDERMVDLLMAEGYHVARRTVTKYRKQLHLPVARLRKVLA